MAEPTGSTGSTGPKYLPGDRQPEAENAAMVRVDHAGEYGAARIYAGQLAVLGNRPVAKTIRQMADQEQRHLERFDTLVAERRVRPTVLSPLWHAAGWMLGAGTALLGERAAMACTVAVEEVIDAHYAQQADQLGDRDPELKSVVEDFRQDELEHRDTALAHGAERAAGYPVLSGAIKAGTRLAIRLSRRW